MPSEVGHLVDTGQTYPVVRLTGVLDAGTASTVWSALVDALAGGPEALIIDVGELTPQGVGALQVLRDVARENNGWPGSQLALCSADAATWRGLGLPVWPSQASAFAALGTPDRESRLDLALEPALSAARRARELVTEACGRWDLAGLAGSASLVITEMVNNVVAHARTPMTVLLARHGDTISVAVRDHSSAQPRFTGPVAPTSYGGRGLLLIDAVARRWGNLALGDGKVVWALLKPEALDNTGMPTPVRG
ncbi:MAG: hypothetical protein QOE51_4654 [Actinoplanes sp.]|jgi:hypothetical protein|nr:hypothetical protein [Actinoplanes sp.]